MATPSDVIEIEGIVSGLLGQKAWRVWKGIGSFVLFEFGKPITHTYNLPSGKRSYTHGEWHLWAYCCEWWLGIGSEIIATSDDDPEFIASSVKQMENIPLESIDLLPPLLETTLHFENGLAFHILPGDYAEDAEDWMLFVPNDYVLVIGPNGKWVYQSSYEPRP